MRDREREAEWTYRGESGMEGGQEGRKGRGEGFIFGSKLKMQIHPENRK